MSGKTSKRGLREHWLQMLGKMESRPRFDCLFLVVFYLFVGSIKTPKENIFLPLELPRNVYSLCLTRTCFVFLRFSIRFKRLLCAHFVFSSIISKCRHFWDQNSKIVSDSCRGSRRHRCRLFGLCCKREFMRCVRKYALWCGRMAEKQPK